MSINKSKSLFAKYTSKWIFVLPILSYYIQPVEASVSANWWWVELNMFSWIMMSIIMMWVIMLIATEKVQRTLVVFFVASVLIFSTYTLGGIFPSLELLTLEQALHSIDGEVILLLVGMMIIVWVLSQTKLFEWLAFKMFVVSKGSIKKLFFMFFLITAVLSAFLDNVTTIFLITPVAISIAKLFEIHPVKLVIPLIISSNVWGAATLIWDPPNIMIWSYANLSFNDFILNMWFPVVIILFAVMFKLYYFWKKGLEWAKKITNFDQTVREMAPNYKIRHKKLLIASLSVLALVVIFFFLHGYFHMPAAVPAVMWAALLMLIRDRLIRRKFWTDRERMEEAVHNTFSKDVEWLVIWFFVFLFMIVWALEHTWILQLAAQYIQNTFSEDILMCALAILWVSAIFSAFLDNIPFTAVMLPVVASLIEYYAWIWIDATFLWWSLAFWACFGWNGTLIWASANIVAAGLLQKEKFTLTFMEYFKVWLPSMFFQVILASVAVYFMYLGTL